MRVRITDMGDEIMAETEVPTIRLAKSGRETPVAWRDGEKLVVSEWRRAAFDNGQAQLRVLARFSGQQRASVPSVGTHV